MLVTNLSGFPSSLTIILIPDGDLRKHKEDFIVNEDLKRLGCSGRVGISIGVPNIAAETKFHQLYRTSDKIDLYKSVIELVKLCQAALMLFGNLEPEYADGLLCDVTEQAVNDWWRDIGSDLYKVEPSDGILGPTTVSALLGTLIGARNRLHVLGAPVAKDVFDIETTKRAIHHFQKTNHINSKRVRLNRHTLHSLHRATVKQASAEGWMLPRAVKSTVAELSGKGGEMVLDIVGGEKATLAEVETTDIERFAQLVRGERAKWLWHGKARKRTTRDLFDEHPGQISTRAEEDFGIASPAAGAEEQEMPSQEHQQLQHQHRRGHQKHASTPTTEAFDPRKTALKRATGRLRGATLGKKGHPSKHSHDILRMPSNNDSYESLESLKSDQMSPVDSRHPENFFDEPSKEDDDFSDRARRQSNRLLEFAPRIANKLNGTPATSKPFVADLPEEHERETSPDRDYSQTRKLDEPIDLGELDRQASRVVETEVSVAEEIAQETDLDEVPGSDHPAQATGVLLQRTQSFSRYETERLEHPSRFRYPRHLSFSLAEESVSTRWDESIEGDEQRHEAGGDGFMTGTDDESADFIAHPEGTMARERLLENKQKAMRAQLALLGKMMAPWITSQVDEITTVDSIASQDTEQIQAIYAPRKEEQQALSDGAKEVLREEKARLQHAVRDLESYGQRLEYELQGLRSKVEDVEDSVEEFERQISFVEDRVNELTKGSKNRDFIEKSKKQNEEKLQSWAQWFKNVFAGARSQKDAVSVISEGMKDIHRAAQENLKDMNEINPLTEAPSSQEVKLEIEKPG